MNENDVEIGQLHQTKVYLMWEDVVRICNNSVAEENKQLKELLKECKHIMSIEKDFASCHFEKDKLCDLLTKIDQVLGENK